MREKFLIRIVLYLIQNVFSIIVSYFMALLLKVSEMGIIYFTNSIIGFFTMFIDFGLIAIYTQHNAEKNFDDYFIVFISLKTIVLIGNFIPFIILCLVYDFGPLTLTFLILNLISFMINQFTQIFTTNLESRLKIIKATLGSFLTNLIQNLLILIILFNKNVISNYLTIIGVILVFASLINLLIFLILSRREIKIKKPDKALMKDFLKATKPFILVTVMIAITQNLGNIIIGLSYGEETLAYYSVINTSIIHFLLIISMQVNTLLNSILPREFENNQIENIELITHKIEKFSSILFLFIAFFIFLNGDLIIRIFLPNYVNSIIYLYLLILVPFFQAIFIPYSSHLIASKRQHIYTNYMIIKAFIILILIIIFVPPNFFSITMLGLGPLGIVFITIGENLVSVVVFRYFSKKMGISYYKKIILHVVYGIIAYIITSVLSIFFIRVFISNDIIYIIINSILFLGIFFIELVIFKELNKEDKIFLFSLLKLSRYRKSLSDEIKK